MIYTNKMNFYVYIYLDPRKPGNYEYGKLKFDYEPYYVGKGSYKRLENHIVIAKGIINKKIKGNFGPTINKTIKILREGYIPIGIKVYTNLYEDTSFRLEKCLIKIIGRKDLVLGPLTNLTDGGDGRSGYVPSDITRKILSNNMKKMWKNEILKIRYGKENPFYGKHHTSKSKEKIGNTMKELWKKGGIWDFSGENNPFYGHHHTPENRKKQSDFCRTFFLGKKQTPEQIQKKADAIKGENNGMFGTNCTKIWIEKYGEEEAMRRYGVWKEKHTGKNNSQYGKKGIEHPTSKVYLLYTPTSEILRFESHEELSKYIDALNKTLDKKLMLNTLRQYGTKNIRYNGYMLKSVKRKMIYK